jgi:hypothetical protein
MDKKLCFYNYKLVFIYCTVYLCLYCSVENINNCNIIDIMFNKGVLYEFTCVHWQNLKVWVFPEQMFNYNFPNNYLVFL